MMLYRFEWGRNYTSCRLNGVIIHNQEIEAEILYRVKDGAS